MMQKLQKSDTSDTLTDTLPMIDLKDYSSIYMCVDNRQGVRGVTSVSIYEG